jgi:hypothetical protein
VTAPLDSFRLLVGADAALRTALADTPPEAFAEAALAMAGRHGLPLQAADLAPLTVPDPLGLLAQEPPPLQCHGWPGPDWLPYRLFPDAVDWADFGGIALDGNFHLKATRAALARPINRLLRCRMTIADFLRGPPEGLRAPDGLVFHMSRCGSTLVARMLAALPGSYAVNEAEPVDAMLHIAAGAPEDVQVAALRAIVGGLGRRPSARWFLKLSAWPTLKLPLFRRAFPDTPWLFLHRDPAAVLASQLAMRGTELEPAITPPALFGLESEAAMTDEDYCAAALARICEAALAEDGGLFVDHADLPQAFFDAILPHFGVPAEAAGMPSLRDLPSRHAKHPDRPWTPDESPIDPAIRAAADTYLASVHARLKAVRGPKSLL